MVYTKLKKEIIIYDKSEFNPEHILECGQVFCFSKTGRGYLVFPENKFAEIIESESGYRIITNDVDYFENYFDLQTDYKKIKNILNSYPLLKEPLKFGYGIRILKQNTFETLISFIISANNNIKRIKLILNKLRTSFRSDDNENSFPTYTQLLDKDEKFFTEIGCGYRAKYLVKVLKQITPQVLEEWNNLETLQLRKKLISLAGIGPKVADCILLFGYGRKDVFPVDTWINKMYNQFYSKSSNREKIRQNLVNEFGLLSGYAQQYLFYYQRSFVE